MFAKRSLNCKAFKINYKVSKERKIMQQVDNAFGYIIEECIAQKEKVDPSNVKKKD